MLLRQVPATARRFLSFSLCCIASACVEPSEEDGDDSYFLKMDAPNGTSSLRGSDGRQFPTLYGAHVSATSTYVMVTQTGDCWISMSLPGTTGPVTLGTDRNTSPSVYYQCTGDGYPDATLTGTASITSRTVNASGGTAAFTVDLSGASMPGTPALTFTGSVSVNITDAAVAGTSNPSGGLNVVCPGTVPSGFQCVSTGGQTAPVRYDIPALNGTWVESSFQVCMTLNTSSGASSFKYKSGLASTGQWGALTNRKGEFQPTSGPYYVYTGATDPQIKLLTWDGSKFVGWGFQKATCPW